MPIRQNHKRTLERGCFASTHYYCFHKRPRPTFLRCNVTRTVNICLFMLFASLLGCSTLSEKQCKTANWTELGERDAYDGYARERLYDHQKACSEYSVAPQTAA